ncbi:MAG: protein-export chaperone SecB [Synergistaceae bacterium]|nr:protein-export chaperone SecB [Synergistaceae bacterium]MBQ6973118.1 protein-export chaperone SecB [Synergistaceae bacterium]
MCSEIPESPFQFSTPELACLEFVPNRDFDAPPNSEVRTSIRMGITVRRNNLAPEAEVELTMNIGEKDVNSPFYIRAVERARFRWEKDMADTTVKVVLEGNAPLLLLSYLRPVIVQITSASAYGACHIPYVDLRKFKPVNYE